MFPSHNFNVMHCSNMNYKIDFMGYIDELVPFYSTNIPKDIYFMYVHCSQYRSSRIPRNS